MKKDIFETLPNYMEGYKSREQNQINIERLNKTIEELKAEILKDPSKAPEIIYERKRQAEINALRLQFTEGEQDNYAEVEIHAINLIIYALTDSKPLKGGAR